MRNDFFSSKADIEAEREVLKNEIETLFSDNRFATYHHTPGLVMMEMRDFVGVITRHAKTTRDKVGEVALLFTLIEAPLRHLQPMLTEEENRADNFAAYCCRKMQIALQKLEKLEPKRQIEFTAKVNQCLELLRAYPPTASRMSEYGLP
jgi:hypothetical protein